MINCLYTCIWTVKHPYSRNSEPPIFLFFIVGNVKVYEPVLVWLIYIVTCSFLKKGIADVGSKIITN